MTALWIALYVLGLFLAIPPLVRWSWKVEQELPPRRRDSRELCAAEGVLIALIWPVALVVAFVALLARGLAWLLLPDEGENR